MVVKGAPDVVLNLCTRYQTTADVPAVLDEATRSRINAANETLTQDALRVLGMAYRVLPEIPEQIDHAQLEKDLIFVGLVGMIDPARPEVQPALERAAQAGIRTIMITGDYPNTARAIAESIDLLRPGHQVLTGAQLDEMDDATLKIAVEQTDVFARVSPEHKMRIVDALKANGEVVAMTGDGVNDAPAIKRADIGVAMGITGTDVAKETADMVLTDDNYASIVSAVEQGRIIYNNIRKFVYYLISCNLAEIVIIFLPTAWPTAFLAHGTGSALTADSHPTAVAQPDHRRRTSSGAGHRKRRPGYHGTATAPAQRADHQQIHALGRRHPDHRHHHGDADCLCHWSIA